MLRFPLGLLCICAEGGEILKNAHNYHKTAASCMSRVSCDTVLFPPRQQHCPSHCFTRGENNRTWLCGVLLNDSQVEFNIWILASRFDRKWIFFALDKRRSWKLFNPGSLVAQKEEDWVTGWTGDIWEPLIHTQHIGGGEFTATKGCKISSVCFDSPSYPTQTP